MQDSWNMQAAALEAKLADAPEIEIADEAAWQSQKDNNPDGCGGDIITYAEAGLASCRSRSTRARSSRTSPRPPLRRRTPRASPASCTAPPCTSSRPAGSTATSCASGTTRSTASPRTPKARSTRPSSPSAWTDRKSEYGKEIWVPLRFTVSVMFSFNPMSACHIRSIPVTLRPQSQHPLVSSYGVWYTVRSPTVQ